MLMMGFTGTGKSTLAEKLSSALETDIFHSAVTRKDLGIKVTKEEAADDLFDMMGNKRKDMDKKVYTENTRRAIESLKQDRNVILDAGHFFVWQRDMIYKETSTFNPEIIIIRTVCDEEEVKKRLAQRLKEFDKSPLAETPSLKAYHSCKEATEYPDDSDLLPSGEKPAIIEYDTHTNDLKVIQGDASSPIVKQITDAIKS